MRLIIKLLNRTKRFFKHAFFLALTKVEKKDSSTSYAFNRISKAGFFFPYIGWLNFDYRQLHNLHYGYSSCLLKKYTNEKAKALIKPSDTVIDCGAFVGGFSVAAMQCNAERLISIEPSSKNYECLKLNIEAKKSKDVEIITLKMGLGQAKGSSKLNLSKSGCDDSFLTPDEGDLHTTEDVEIETIQNLIAEYSIDPKHLFLKVEAEGFEPEIIEGIGSVKPRVIAVDVTPERDNESPRELISGILKTKGYEHIYHTDRCLFATTST
mgnify:CR=1 FL=1